MRLWSYIIVERSDSKARASGLEPYFQADYSSNLAFTPHSLNHPRPRCLSASCGFMAQQSTFEAAFNAPVTHPNLLTNPGGQFYAAIHRTCHILSQFPAVRLPPCCSIAMGANYKQQRRGEDGWKSVCRYKDTLSKSNLLLSLNFMLTKHINIINSKIYQG